MQHSISEKNLKNGAKLLVINVPNSSSIFFSSIVRAGDYFAPNGKWELPHLLEHLAFMGNQKYPEQSEFMFEIEKNGAYQNATTGVILIRYYYLTGRKELFDIIPLGLAQINRPLFKKEDVEAEKKVVRNELNRRFDRMGFLVTDANELKLNKRLKSTAEQIASLNTISRQDVLDYFNHTHTAQNTHFIVAGDLGENDVEKVISLIEKGMENYPQGKELEDPQFLWGQWEQRVSVLERPDAKQDYFSFYFVSNDFSDELIPKARVFHALFNQGLYARLPSRVRKLGLSYSTHSGISLNPQVCKLYIEDQVPPKNTLRLFEEILKQLKELAEGNYTDAELERAKGYVRGSAESYYQLPQHFVGWYEYDYIMRGKIFSLNDYFEQITKVERDDIAEAAKILIQKGKWTLSILGNGIGEKETNFEGLIQKYFG